MRVLGFNLKDSDSSLKRGIQNDLHKFINIDNLDSLEDTEYFLMIRTYDLIIINLDSSNYKNYLNIFKEMNSVYSSKEFTYKFIITIDKNLLSQNSFKSSLESMKDSINKIYKQISPEFIIFEAQSSPFTNLIKSYFYKTPSIIKSIDINISKQLVSLSFNEDSFDIFVKSKKDMHVLLHFIRHYGEVINIEMILSGISKEPELSNASPVESAISSLRKVFELLNIRTKKPIVALKRVGYRFEI